MNENVLTKEELILIDEIDIKPSIKKQYRNKEWLYNQYRNEDKSTTEIGEMCGVADVTIGYWLRKYNIKRRTKLEGILLKHGICEQLYKDKEWLYEQYWIKNKSTVDIGKECKTHSNTIQYWMKKHDIPKRTLSSAQKISWGRPEIREKLSEAMKGKKIKPFSKEHKKKISDALKGEKSYNWKGNKAKEYSIYRRYHVRVKRLKSKPKQCEDCDKKTTKLALTFNYFHKNRKPIYYTFNPNDYTWRCIGYAGCHKKYDKQFQEWSKERIEEYTNNLKIIKNKLNLKW